MKARNRSMKNFTMKDHLEIKRIKYEMEKCRKILSKMIATRLILRRENDFGSIHPKEAELITEVSPEILEDVMEMKKKSVMFRNIDFSESLLMNDYED